MKRLPIYVYLLLLVAVCMTTYSQGSNQWQFVSIEYVPFPVNRRFEVSTHGSFIAEHDPDLNIVNIAQARTDFYPRKAAISPAWLGETVIYAELEWRGLLPPGCGSNLTTFGYYDAVSQTSTVTCLETPQILGIERYPYNEYTIFANRNLLIDLQNSTVQDLSGSLSTSITLSEILNWNGYGRTWWDNESQSPQAYLQVHSSEYGQDLVQTVKVCPLVGDQCQTLLRIQDYVYGNLSDITISPDGQTLLWSSIVFKDEEPLQVTSPLGLVDDVAAFATDVQTGVTTELFRLSNHFVLPSKGVATRWSPDGQTLVISVRAINRVGLDNNGMVIATFLPPR